MQETTIQRRQTAVKRPAEMASGHEHRPDAPGCQAVVADRSALPCAPRLRDGQPAVSASAYAPVFGRGAAGKSVVRNGPAANPRSVWECRPLAPTGGGTNCPHRRRR